MKSSSIARAFERQSDAMYESQEKYWDQRQAWIDCRASEIYDEIYEVEHAEGATDQEIMRFAYARAKGEFKPSCLIRSNEP